MINGVYYMEEMNGQKEDIKSLMLYYSDMLACLSLMLRYPNENVYKLIKEFYENFNNLLELYGIKGGELPNREDMEVEYIRLFEANLGGVIAPLYSSVYTSKEKLLLRDSTVELRMFMAGEGFAIKDDLKDIEDNIYIMLEFLSMLFSKMDEGEANKLSIVKKVLSDYINPMLDQFSEKVENGSKLNLYKNVAQLLREGIKELSENIDFLEKEYLKIGI